MREAFHSELAALTGQLGGLADLAHAAMRDATAGLLGPNVAAAERAIALHPEIEALRGHCEQRVMSMLVRQAPVASDLRLLFSALRIAGDLARMGGLAVHIAESVRRRFPDRIVPSEIGAHIAEMGALSVGMAGTVREALTASELRPVAGLRRTDHRMDGLHAQLLAKITDDAWAHGVTVAVDLALISRFYERFADHAVEVADRIVFLATGERPTPSD